MHSLKEVLDKIDTLQGDIKSLTRLLIKNAPPIPFTFQTFLRLNLSQIRVSVALDSLGRKTRHSASEVDGVCVTNWFSSLLLARLGAPADDQIQREVTSYE